MKSQFVLPDCDDLRILIVCMKHPNGNASLGYTYEWIHFFQSLKEILHQVDFFDYLDSSFAGNQNKMQKCLLNQIKDKQYDIVFFSFDMGRFEDNFIRSLSNHTKTFCFFMDDNWRQGFVKKWAPLFNAFSTAMINGEQHYNDLGMSHAVFFPFGVNENVFSPDASCTKDIDVSFVGAWHPYREWLIKRLKKAGISVEVHGARWPGGGVSLDEMIAVFRRSKISLNLSNSISYDVRYLLSSPRCLINTIRSKKRGEQIKGRHFEIPACQTFQLSYYIEGLERLFNIGSEMSIFSSVEDLITKVQFFLTHQEEREKIAAAGFNRVLQEHTYGKRFLEIFHALNWCTIR